MKSMSCAVVLLAVLASGVVMAEELKISGGEGIFIQGEVLETLWEEGGFTEGAAAGPNGNMYFSDFAQPFDSGPARVMRFDPRTGKTTV